MSSDPKLFRVNPENRASESVREVDFAQLGLRERQDIQEWVVANPTILGGDLLIIGKEFSDFDRTNERLDLLAVDRDGKLVIIELKRDDSGADVHWQAIKYASYFARATATDIINLLSRHDGISYEAAESRLQQHLGADDLNALNHDQRIILASHRFAPEVTNAVLWLNEKAPGENLITCFKLTPYQDGDALYLQSSRFIPMPDTEGLRVGLRDSSGSDVPAIGLTFGRGDTSHQSDDITRFLRDVEERAKNGLPDQLKPERQSRWASKGPGRRHYTLWYGRQPWGSNGVHYRIAFYQVRDGHPEGYISRWSGHRGRNPEEFSYSWLALVYFSMPASIAESLKARLKEVKIDENGHQQIFDEDWGFNIELDRVGNALDPEFADALAATLRRFIEVVTPVVDDFFENEGNEAES